MSIRTFFDQRLLLPGFSFITVLVFLNPEIVCLAISNQTNTNLGTILVSILAVPALGFLISQPWFFFYQRIITPDKVWGRRWEKIRKQYNFKNNQKFENLKVSDWFFYDYLPEHKLLTKQIQLYLDRRWDLFSTMGSTVFSILIAVIINVIFKRFILINSLSYSSNLSLIFNLNYYYVFIYSLISITIIVLISGMLWLRNEVNSISEAIMNEHPLDRGEIVKAFPILEIEEEDNTH